MIVLELEHEILKLDATIEALPYWDVSILSNDNVKSLDVFFRFFGSAPGSGDNYQVVDGYFGKFPLAKSNDELWQSFDTFRRSIGSRNVTTYGTSTASGYLRDTQNENMNPYVTRYPTWIFDPVNGTCVMYDPHHVVPWEGVHPFCSHAGNGTLISWYYCIEVRRTMPCFTLVCTDDACIRRTMPCFTLVCTDDACIMIHLHRLAST